MEHKMPPKKKSSINDKGVVYKYASKLQYFERAWELPGAISILKFKGDHMFIMTSSYWLFAHDYGKTDMMLKILRNDKKKFQLQHFIAKIPLFSKTIVKRRGVSLEL